MDKATAIARLKAHEAELRAMGVLGLSLFGSVARGEAGPGSDVDVAVTLDRTRPFGMFKFAALEGRLRDLLNTPVDLLGEPARDGRMQPEIDRDRARAF
ncbi:MAG: nucleotidyltransferase domain-containing protein [Sphingomonadaceae bacterium]|nr:nucleotidyltransferase domain-containing protein [Sphingomonadaceae bacterium]